MHSGHYLPQTNALSSNPYRHLRNTAKKGANSNSKPQLSTSVAPQGADGLIIPPPKQWAVDIPCKVKSSKLQKYEYKNGVLQKERAIAKPRNKQDKGTFYKNVGKSYGNESINQLSREVNHIMLIADPKDSRNGGKLIEKPSTQRQSKRGGLVTGGRSSL